jgi:hypothetical protein
MTLNSQCQDALNDNTPGLKFSSERGLEYETCATPSRYEPAPIHNDLAATILNALGRDDRLRWTYVRRRWQGVGD